VSRRPFAPRGSYGDRILSELAAAEANGEDWVSVAELRRRLGVTNVQAFSVALNRLVARGILKRDRSHGYHRPRYQVRRFGEGP
jgi:DNA-binding IclR family transcriptional regulator